MSLLNMMDDYGNYITDWNYREIIALDRILTAMKIPHSFEKFMDGWQILYPTKKRKDENGVTFPVISVIEHCGSYGHEKDLLEIMGLLTPEEEQCDSVAGGLTADNVYYRIKKHWEKLKSEDEADND